jgi:molybdopterin/thiamine biosynthesis adenylyltransferase
MNHSIKHRDSTLSLSHLKIALIGCGAIGSQLAQMLVGYGAGLHHSLRLFDKENLMLNDIHRHFGGLPDVGKNKAEATASAISRLFPDRLLKVFPGNAFYHWNEIEGCDLVIDTTGDWYTQSSFNESLMFGDKNIKALLYAWVFLKGEASQCFLNLNDEYACFQCLRPDMDEQWHFSVTYEDDKINPPHLFFPRKNYPVFTDDHIVAANLAAMTAVNWADDKPCGRLMTVEFEEGRPHGESHCFPRPAENCSICSEIRRN